MAVSYPVNIKDPDVRRGFTGIVNELNRDTNPIEFTVAVAGTEVAVEHGLDYVPTGAIPIFTEDTTGQGVIYPGTTAWTTKYVYLTATATGVYHVRIRR